MAVKIIHKSQDSFVAKCPLCGCEFSYQTEDVMNSGSTKFAFCIECPECGYEIPHKANKADSDSAEVYCDNKTDHSSEAGKSCKEQYSDWYKQYSDWYKNWVGDTIERYKAEKSGHTACDNKVSSANPVGSVNLSDLAARFADFLKDNEIIKLLTEYLAEEDDEEEEDEDSDDAGEESDAREELELEEEKNSEEDWRARVDRIRKIIEEKIHTESKNK